MREAIAVSPHYKTVITIPRPLLIETTFSALLFLPQYARADTLSPPSLPHCNTLEHLFHLLSQQEHCRPSAPQSHCETLSHFFSPFLSTKVHDTPQNPFPLRHCSKRTSLWGKPLLFVLLLLPVPVCCHPAPASDCAAPALRLLPLPSDGGTCKGWGHVSRSGRKMMELERRRDQRWFDGAERRRAEERIRDETI